MNRGAGSFMAIVPRQWLEQGCERGEDGASHEGQSGKRSGTMQGSRTPNLPLVRPAVAGAAAEFRSDPQRGEPVGIGEGLPGWRRLLRSQSSSTRPDKARLSGSGYTFRASLPIILIHAGSCLPRRPAWQGPHGPH